MIDWIRSHPELMAWLGVSSVVMFAAGFFLTPFVVARMPADHFLKPPGGAWRRRHPVIRGALWVLVNVIGAALVIAGIAMLVLPGQGILTILVGLSLMQFSGKRRIEVAIVSRKPVRKAIDWLRRRAGREPLRLPGDDQASESA